VVEVMSGRIGGTDSAAESGWEGDAEGVADAVPEGFFSAASCASCSSSNIRSHSRKFSAH
jgi:hypothetical protein